MSLLYGAVSFIESFLLNEIPANLFIQFNVSSIYIRFEMNMSNIFLVEKQKDVNPISAENQKGTNTIDFVQC